MPLFRSKTLLDFFRSMEWSGKVVSILKKYSSRRDINQRTQYRYVSKASIRLWRGLTRPDSCTFLFVSSISTKWSIKAYLIHWWSLESPTSVERYLITFDLELACRYLQFKTMFGTDVFGSPTVNLIFPFFDWTK